MIFLSIFLFILLYAFGQDGLMFTQLQVFVDKIIRLLGPENTLLPTLNRTALQWIGGLRDKPDGAT